MADQKKRGHRWSVPLARGGRGWIWATLCIALAGCYRHRPEAHAIRGDEPRLYVRPSRTLHRFVRTVEGARQGQGELSVVRDTTGGLRLNADLELGPHHRVGGRLRVAPSGEPESFRAWVELFGHRRELVGARQRFGFNVDIQGPGGRKQVRAPWGPSSALDPGHPLLWGPLLARAPARALRVLRVGLLSEPPLGVDHFELEDRGSDAWGRRIYVQTRSGPLAIWLAEDGHPLRVRSRPSGPGTARVEWVRDQEE